MGTYDTLQEIRRQFESDAALLREFSLVNGGTRKECSTCSYARRDVDIPRSAPVCWQCTHYPIDRPKAYTRTTDNWMFRR